MPETVAESVSDVSELSISALSKMLDGEISMVPDETEVVTTEPSEAAQAAESIAAEPDTAKDKQEPVKADDPDADLDSKNGLKKRFSKLTSKIRDLETELAKRPATPEAKPEVAKPAVDLNEPQSANFETYEAYVKALTRYELKLDRDGAIAQTAQEKTLQAWETRVEAAKAKYADFDETVLTPEVEIKISKAVEQTILGSEYGPDLAYFLGKNPEEAARISALSPLAAAAAIGRIEATFTKTPEPKTQAVKPLPKPPAQVDGKSSPTVDLNDPNLSQEAFNKLARKSLRHPSF